MERYDGKTKRHDHIKYALITFGVIVIIAALILSTYFMKKQRQSNPDFRVVIGSEEAFSEAMLTDLEFAFREVVGDRNGDNKVVVEIEVLRLTDYGQAKIDDMEDTAGEENFSGLTEGDESRMLLMMNSGEYSLFLLSDQPRGSFRGAASTYCEQGYFVELPADIADEADPCRCDISGAPFWAQIGIEDVPFYACVLDTGDAEEQTFAVEVARKLKTAYVTLW